MKIFSLKLEGWMLYKQFFRVFGDKDVIGIVAEYAGDRQRSNKGGKSTVIEAILYALTGISRATREVDLIHRGADEMLVTLVLDNDGKRHTIKRGRDRKNVGFIEADRITNSYEAQKYINELIGYSDPKDLTLTNFFKQNDINQFLEMKPAQMQKHLMRWFENDHWAEAEKSAREDLNKLDKRKTALSAKKELLLSQSVDTKALRKKILATKSSIQQQNDLAKKTKVRIKMLEDLCGSVDVSEVKAALLRERSALDRTLADVEELKELKEEIRVLKTAQVLKYAVKTDDETLERVEKQLRAKRAQLDILAFNIKTAKKFRTGMCPVLSEACDRIEFSTEAVEGWEEQIAACEEDADRLAGTVQEIKAARAAEKQAQERARDLKKACERRDRFGDPGADLAPLKAKIKALKKQLVRGQNKENADKITALHDAFATINSNINELYGNLGRLNQELKTAKRNKKRLDRIDEISARLQRRIEVQRYVAFMFGKSGIPGQEIENGFEEIEDETNFVLEKFGSGLSIIFSADRELKPWEPACLACGWVYPKGTKSQICLECGVSRQKKRKDELAVKVYENGEDFDFSMESGGGKTLVSFANRLALTRMKQRKSGSSFNVLFLDEPDSALDKPNKRAFMDIVTQTLIKKFGFQQVFWVTHDVLIQESTPHVLKVTRHKSHSVARWL